MARTPQILVIDDNPSISDLVRLFLERTGRFFVCVENRSAQAIFTALQCEPDMVLLDVDMPGKNGKEVYSEFKTEPTLCNVPVVFLTSTVSEEVAGKSEADLAGSLYLAKPVNAQVLVEVVDRVLAMHCIAA